MATKEPASPDDLLADPLLREAPTVEGFKVLDPAVLYAKVGAGGMGAVYRGRHFKLDLDVAVKCLKPSLAAEEPDFVKRFEREARLAASIAHQNVVRVMDVQEKNGLHYLVMEFVRGETAAERVKRKGPLSEKEALAILYGACAGLAEAHARGIVHRDIKPDNIMVSLEGRVKLADLGLAKSQGNVDGRSVSMPASRIMGTPQYMPPEQWDTTDVTAAADVWALGATFFYLCAGRAGISGKGTYHAVAKRIQDEDYPTLRAERQDLRPAVHAIFERCVMRDAKDRYPDARALLKELKKLAIDDDEEVLLDPETGTGIARAGVVTPPPKQTLLRIRAQVETSLVGKPTEAEPAGGFAPKTEGNTVPSPSRTVAPKRRSPVLLLAPALLLGALGFGYAQGWFTGAEAGKQGNETARANEAAPPPKVEPKPADAGKPTPLTDASKADARTALAAAQQALPLAGQLDVAIEQFERALQLDPSLAEAKKPLANALSRKAEKLATEQPDTAFALCRRAVELQPDNKVALARHEELRTQLMQRVQAGLKLEAPKADQLLAIRQLIAKGASSSPKVKVALVAGSVVPATFPVDARAADVIEGTFSIDQEFPKDGEFLLWVEGEDGNGVRATIAPVRVVVDTTDPVLVLQQPLANTTVGAKVAVGGKVTDASVCSVTVNGQAAKVEGERWSIDLPLRDGVQELVVDAKDAGGRSAVAVKRSIVVDAKGPEITLATLPKVTKDAQIAITGTVKDLQDGMLRVGGSPVAVGADGKFSVPLPLPNDQEYSVLVEANDKLGNPSSERVVLRRDTVPPVVEWTTPADGKVRAGEVEVAGTVQDDGGVASVTVNGQPATLRGGKWTAKVRVDGPAAGSTLLPVTRVTVVATDVAGNASKPELRLLTAAPAFGAKIESGIGLTMIRIEPKPFTMGTPGNTGDEAPHQVTITKPYWIGETEVTQAQWKAVMGAKNWGGDYEKSGDRYPATSVSWTDAVAFCEKLTKSEGAAGRLPQGYRYGLPSEAEWEYACRGGATTAFCYGDDEGRLSEFAVFAKKFEKGNSADPVRTKKANAFGLYDMHGNVWEWCADYAEFSGGVVTDTYNGPKTDPLSVGGSQRVLRGGSWFDAPAGCRSADRVAYDPGDADYFLGFRPALLARSSSK